MPLQDDVDKLADVLNGIGTLYQFRSPDKRLYGALTVSQSYCLRILYFFGPKTMGELAGHLKVGLSTITGVVDQLEAKGLVERIDHPEDRRSLHVRLTAKGRALYQVAHEAFLAYIRPLFGRKSAEEREALLAFLRDVRESLHSWQKNPKGKGARRGKTNS